MLTYYQHLTIVNYDGPPTPDEVAALEVELGTTLPPDFRDFLEVANGGYLPYLVNVPPTAEGEPISFCSVFSTKPNARGELGYGTFLGEIRGGANTRGIPQHILPFAEDGGGSTVYLDLTDTGRGRAVAFVHGLPSWTGRNQEDAFVELADSFSSFIALLYPNPEDDWTE